SDEDDGDSAWFPPRRVGLVNVSHEQPCLSIARVVDATSNENACFVTDGTGIQRRSLGRRCRHGRRLAACSELSGRRGDIRSRLIPMVGSGLFCVFNRIEEKLALLFHFFIRASFGAMAAEIGFAS